MPETATSPSTKQPAPTNSKVESTHRVIHTISMVLGIAGAIGASGVWLAANFYVGDVEIKPDKPVQSMVVKVYDRKGGESTFHLARFQLMPGNYHLEISPDGNQISNADVEVKYGQKSEVPLVVASGHAESADNADNASEKPHKDHWWQFWRK